MKFLPAILLAILPSMSLAADPPSPKPLTEIPNILTPNTELKLLAKGMGFTEGPVWLRDNLGDSHLIFSDIPANQLKRWNPRTGELSTFRDPSNNTNGNTTDPQGRLVSANHGTRNVTRTESDGTITTLVEEFDGKKFNSPNDVVVKSDGTIWFTDPTYGLEKRPKEQSANHVFCFNPQTKIISPVISDFDQPNGLCFSPDEKHLYIADSGKPHHIRIFNVEPDPSSQAGWKLTNGKLFATIDKGVPDGIRCDQSGNLFSSAGDGVQIFAPDGKLLGRIPVPQSPANLCFGADDHKTLFLTARGFLYSVQLLTPGAKRP